MTACTAGPATFPTAVWESRQAASLIKQALRGSVPLRGSPASLHELTPELPGIEAMLGYLAVRQKNHRHIQVVKFAQFGIGIDIDLAQSSAKFSEQWRHLRFRLVT